MTSSGGRDCKKLLRMQTTLEGQKPWTTTMIDCEQPSSPTKLYAAVPNVRFPVRIEDELDVRADDPVAAQFAGRACNEFDHRRGGIRCKIARSRQ